MRNAVFQVFFSSRLEAEAFIKSEQISLCSDFNFLIFKKLLTHLDAAAHEIAPGPCAARSRTAHHPANGYIAGIRYAFGQQTRITKQFALFVAAHEVPCRQVFAISIQIRAILLYDEDFLAERHDVIEFKRGEIVKKEAGECEHFLLLVISLAAIGRRPNASDGQLEVDGFGERGI